MDTYDDILWDYECKVFASMMSFMGMAMNPAEAAMAGDTSNAEGQDAASNTQSSSDDDNNSDTGAEGGDTGAVEPSGFDAGGGDFVGDFEF